ncbi:butyrophilin-like protein 1 [Diadema setosum]|uniref:butyrophilin-like protein 1 n=1 Tax=Diadema setosum TaxID=31175 RepID=UPI003B3AC505
MIFFDIPSTRIHRPASVVGTAPTAVGWKGGDIQLPCSLQEEPFAVYWIKENRSDPDQLIYKAIFYNGDLTIIEERFNIMTNFSLVITELEVADEGHYHCQVVLESFKDYSNSTRLTVNSMATEHVIEQCVREVHGSNPCTIQASREAQTVHLDCRLSGFKPNVSLVWTTSGNALPSVRSIQYALPDGTFERLETIAVTASQDTDQNITCTASGVSMDRASSKFITVLSLNDQKDVPGPNKIALGIGLTLFFVVLITVLFFGVGTLLLTYRPELLPNVKERKKLRARIRDYRPGSASECNLGNLARVNINLFGQMSAGKSSLINSIFFAYTGPPVRTVLAY